MAPASSLSVIVPALNEEKNLEAAIRTITSIAPRYFREVECLIFNDGSKDDTGDIADRLSKKDSRLRVIHHPTPRNIGGCYREGIRLARHEFLILVPGDNECAEEVLHPVLALAGTADMIIPFTCNQEERAFLRRVLSLGFVQALNLLSGRRLRYYNGAVLHRTSLLRECSFQTDGFGYQAEILIKQLGRGLSYREVATRIRPRPHGRSKALRLTNFWQTARFLLSLSFNRG